MLVGEGETRQIISLLALMEPPPAHGLFSFLCSGELHFLGACFLRDLKLPSHSLPGKLYLGEGERKKIKARALEGQPKSTTLNASAACFK